MKRWSASLQRRIKQLNGKKILPPLSRTAAILVPVHIAGFLALYIATIAIVQREIIQAHSDSARVFANHVIEELHPVMVTSESTEIRAGLENLANTHDLLNLQLYDAAGAPLSDTAHQNPHVDELLLSEDQNRFDLVATENGWHLHGAVAISANGWCADCHHAGEVVGFASMSYDLTPFVSSARGRIRHSLGLLMVGWLVVMSVISYSTRRMVVRSMVRLRADISDPESAGGGEIPTVSKLVLDPVSKQLLASLQEVVGNQKKRERDVASRLHHTERLASFGQLAAGLAHEIKNPIAGIQGVLEILRDEATDESQRDLFERLIGETRRINETVQELLHFARPGEPRKVATDVAELLEDSVQLLIAGFARRDISVKYSTGLGMPMCALDPTQIRQVIVNLINNAGEAIESGGSIDIRATEIPDGGGVILAVADDGPGIPPDELERIFEPFHTTKMHGTGLGLAVARTLVAQHGGTIEVDSELGCGSTFLIILPNDAGAENGGRRHNG